MPAQAAVAAARATDPGVAANQNRATHVHAIGAGVVVAGPEHRGTRADLPPAEQDRARTAQRGTGAVGFGPDFLACGERSRHIGRAAGALQPDVACVAGQVLADQHAAADDRDVARYRGRAVQIHQAGAGRAGIANRHARRRVAHAVDGRVDHQFAEVQRVGKPRRGQRQDADMARGADFGAAQIPLGGGERDVASGVEGGALPVKQRSGADADVGAAAGHHAAGQLAHRGGHPNFRQG